MSNLLGPARTIPGYPGFASVGPVSPGHDGWDGTIQPFARCNLPEIAHLLNDLTDAAQIFIRAGALMHDPTCARPHTAIRVEPLMTTLKLMAGAEAETFRVRIVVPPAPRHPRAFVVYPEISDARFPGHPHLFRNLPRPGLPELPGVDHDAPCTYRPGAGEWSRSTSTLTTFVDFVALYLAKHIVWRRTRWAFGEGGVWLGPEASHDPKVLVNTIPKLAECWCGSGDPYERCHRQFDVARAAAA